MGLWPHLLVPNESVVTCVSEPVFVPDPLRAAQQQQQQQAVMAAVAAATGMRTALFAQAAAAQAAQSVVGPHSAVNGLFGGKTRHNSIDKPAPNRSRLLEDFRCIFNLLFISS